MDMNGIACHDGVVGTGIKSVSIALVSGHGSAFYQGGGGVDGGGLWVSRLMIQRPGKNGVHQPVNDANIHNVYVQYAGRVAGASLGHGFYTTPGSGGNERAQAAPVLLADRDLARAVGGGPAWEDEMARERDAVIRPPQPAKEVKERSWEFETARPADREPEAGG